MNIHFGFGRITKDLTLSKTTSGTSYLKFTLAVDKFVKDGEKATEYLEYLAWGKNAENIAKFSQKGSQLNIISHIENSRREKDGKTVYYTNLVVDRFEFGAKPALTSMYDNQPDENHESPFGNHDIAVDFGDDLPF